VATNLQIKFIKSLQLKKNRYEHKLYVCEGAKIVDELQKFNDSNIEQIYATQEWADEQKRLPSTLEIVSQKDIEKMSGLSTAPSVLAVVRFSKLTKIDFEPNISLFLDQLADPGNLGTIIRTADWYGLKQIFLSPNSVDIYSPKVIQASMGAHFRVRCIEIDFEELIKINQFKNIYATAMKGENINQVEDVKNSLIVMGSESHGVSKSIFEKCTVKITIPSYGDSESLNVSVATGIILHQLVSKKY